MCREFYGISAPSAKPWFLQVSFRGWPIQKIADSAPNTNATHALFISHKANEIGMTLMAQTINRRNFRLHPRPYQIKIAKRSSPVATSCCSSQC